MNPDYIEKNNNNNNDNDYQKSQTNDIILELIKKMDYLIEQNENFKIRCDNFEAEIKELKNKLVVKPEKEINNILSEL